MSKSSSSASSLANSHPPAPASPNSDPSASSNPVASSSAPTLYLIPSFLDEQSLAPLPAYILDAVKQCRVFFVENERSARRYLKMLWREMVIDDYEWFTIHKAEQEVMASFNKALKQGLTIGLISEAGCPGIADPGQILTAAAHQAGAIVRPLVGPSSILLALMASGMNGQQFRFCGYLPVDIPGRTKGLKELEAESQQKNCTMIFIETPYRNNQLMDTIFQTCRPSTRLSIAVNLTGTSEFIRTRSIADWKSSGSAPRFSAPDLHKQPTIFCLLSA